MKTTAIALLALIVLMLPQALFPCTTFALKDKAGNLYFGRNFDFGTGLGQIQINQRNVIKTAAPLPGEKPFTWIATYGSLSFNQNGREFPYGGINEAGLVIAQMMHESAACRYPEKDDRAGLAELNWIQYQLDVAATVTDIQASDKTVRISNSSVAPLHFLAADAKGHVAVIEYVDGHMIFRSGADLPVTSCANDTYADALAYYKKLTPEERAAIDNPDGVISSENRFSRSAHLMQTYPVSEDPVAYSLDVLKKVSSRGTKWSLVYDLSRRIVHLRTSENPRLRTFALKDFPLACGGPRLWGDIDSVRTPKDFLPYSPKANAALIENVWNQVDFLRALPPELRKLYATFGDEARRREPAFLSRRRIRLPHKSGARRQPRPRSADARIQLGRFPGRALDGLTIPRSETIRSNRRRATPVMANGRGRENLAPRAQPSS
jgi:penicillin V acylase-like amidase (Ntn superfamily)